MATAQNLTEKPELEICASDNNLDGENVLPKNDDTEPIWPVHWKAWTSLLGCFLLMFNSWGLVNAYGTFSSYYMQHLLPGYDILLLNLVGSTESFIVLILSFIAGRLLDAGYVKYLLRVGATLVTIGMLSLSFVNGTGDRSQGKYGLIWLTQGLIVGLGMACFFVASSQIVATWFIKRKSFAIGIVASGASIAGLVYPVMTKYMISSHGFNAAVRYVTILVGVTAVASVFLAVPNPEHLFRKPEKWSAVRVWIDTSAPKNPAFKWYTLSICALFFGFYPVFFNLEEWAATKGLGYKDQVPGGFDDVTLNHEVRGDAIRTFWLLSIMNASSTVGRVGGAYLSDLYGALNIHIIVTAVASVFILTLWLLANTVAAAVAFVVLFGVVSGAVIGLPPASMAYILGNDPLARARLGHWTGMMYSTSAAFALTGPVIAGHLISRFGTYETVQGWSGACLMISAIFMGIARCYSTRSRNGCFMPESVKQENVQILKRLSTATKESIPGASDGEETRNNSTSEATPVHSCLGRN